MSHHPTSDNVEGTVGPFNSSIKKKPDKTKEIVAAINDDAPPPVAMKGGVKIPASTIMSASVAPTYGIPRPASTPPHIARARKKVNLDWPLVASLVGDDMPGLVGRALDERCDSTHLKHAAPTEFVESFAISAVQIQEGSVDREEMRRKAILSALLKLNNHIGNWVLSSCGRKVSDYDKLILVEGKAPTIYIEAHEDKSYIEERITFSAAAAVIPNGLLDEEWVFPDDDDYEIPEDEEECDVRLTQEQAQQVFSIADEALERGMAKMDDETFEQNVKALDVLASQIGFDGYADQMREARNA